MRMFDEGALPVMTIEVKGREFTPESLVIAALMRKLGVDRIELTSDDLAEPKGLSFPSPKIPGNGVAIELTEHETDAGLISISIDDEVIYDAKDKEQNMG